MACARRGWRLPTSQFRDTSSALIKKFSNGVFEYFKTIQEIVAADTPLMTAGIAKPFKSHECCPCCSFLFREFLNAIVKLQFGNAVMIHQALQRHTDPASRSRLV